jgi:hypothetical protein
MYGPHFCTEYIKGVDAFIDFVKKDMLDRKSLLSLQTLQDREEISCR